MSHSSDPFNPSLSYSQAAAKPKPKPKQHTLSQTSKSGTASYSSPARLAHAQPVTDQKHHTISLVDASHSSRLITPIQARSVQAILEKAQYDQLVAYIQSGNLEAIQRFEQAEPGLIHRPNKAGASLLQAAVFYEQVPIVKFLLSQSVDINAVDSKNNTALTVAMSQANLLLIHILIESGAICLPKQNQLFQSFKKKCPSFCNVLSTLLTLHHQKRIKRSNPKNPNDTVHLQTVLQSMTQNCFNTSSLSLAMTLACKHNQNAWLLFLLTQSVSLYQQDSDEKMAIDYLLEHKNTIVFEILMHSKCWKGLLEGFKMQVFQALCDTQDIRLLQLFINKNDVNEDFMIAVLDTCSFNTSQLKALIKPSTLNV